MRINRLKFKGVGPFKDEFDIDFDALGGAALYLIDGPTGAGKTTILDCIVYALYGETSVEGSDNSRIRSDFAGVNDETFIELTFTTSDGTFLVRRTPGYTRAAKRGGGTTPEDPTATLSRLDSNGIPVTPFEANKVRSVNEAIPEKVGLSRSQFVQTMVLPQGQFAEFLRSDTGDRLPLLQKIFGVELFKRILEILQDRAKTARAADELAANQLKAGLAGFNEHVGLEPAELEVFEKLIQLRADDDLAREVKAAVQQQADQAEVAKLAHDAALAQQTAAEDLHNARKIEQASQAALTEANSALADSTNAESAQLAEIAASPELAAHFGLTLEVGQADDVWVAAKSKVDQLVGELDAVITVEQAVAAWPATLAKLDSAVTAAEAAVTKLNDELAAIPAELAKLEGVVEGLVDAGNELTAAQQAVDALQSQAELHAKVDQWRTRVEQARAAATVAAGDFDLAEQNRTSLVARRIAGMAAELALDLQPGSPCPVCGNTVHPDKAAAAADAVTPEQVEQADQAARQAREKSDTEGDQYKSLTAELAQLEQQVTTSLEELSTKQAEAASRLQAATAARTKAKERVDQRTKLETRQTQILTEQVGANVKFETSKTARAGQLAQHEANVNRIIAALAGYESVAERVADLRAFSGRLERMAGVARKRAAAVAAQALAQAEFNALPQHADFGKVAEALAALKFAQALVQDTNSNHKLAEARHRNAAKTGKQLVDGAQQRAAKYADNKTLLEVATLFSKNQDGMTLEVFVLQELFEAVVAAANRRFETLLEGRFRLVTTDKAKGGGKKGLDLNVRDLSINEERMANTLSGGETFCASLALALGMADVVKAEHGGIAIDTLFIDEGFGSLDMDRLNDVMNMLQALQSHGRTVGVISHVEEMKNQISESIKVIAGGKGHPSSLEVSWMQ